jgi:GNAT superfamily N-acetyltransferase
MNIRIADTKDIPSILEMAKKFISTTKYTYDEGVIEHLVTSLLAADKTLAIILISDGGFIAGVSNQFVFGLHRQATELAWWVEPEARSKGVGKELLDAFEYWAQNVAKCKTVTMVSLDDELGKYYEKNGYELFERAYMKEF